MAEITVSDSRHAVRVESGDELRAIARRLAARAEYADALDAEDVLTQAEEANAVDPVG